MIFALATDDKTLMVFPEDADAIAYCEGVDVEDGNWLFFDSTGKPLVAEFLKPNVRDSLGVQSGKYVLRPGSIDRGSYIAGASFRSQGCRGTTAL